MITFYPEEYQCCFFPCSINPYKEPTFRYCSCPSLYLHPSCFVRIKRSKCTFCGQEWEIKFFSSNTTYVLIVRLILIFFTSLIISSILSFEWENPKFEISFLFLFYYILYHYDLMIQNLPISLYRYYNWYESLINYFVLTSEIYLIKNYIDNLNLAVEKDKYVFIGYNAGLIPIFGFFIPFGMLALYYMNKRRTIQIR